MKWSALKSNRMVKVLRKSASDWYEDGALRLSAALAYYSVFSIAPLIILAMAIAGWALGPEAVAGQLDDQLRSYIGQEAAAAVQALVKSTSGREENALGSIVGVVTLLIGASSIFGQLKDALNSIWDVELKAGTGVKSFIMRYVLNFGMVLVIGFLLLSSLLLSTALAALSKWMGTLYALPTPFWAVAGTAVSLGMATLLFAAIFKLLPDAKVAWRSVWVGAGLTALLFEGGKFGLAFYLGRETTTSGFGAAGSVVLLLLWVYYASAILLFGAEFTQVYATETGHRLQAKAGAEIKSDTDPQPSTVGDESPAPLSPPHQIYRPGDGPPATLSGDPTTARPGSDVPTIIGVFAFTFVLGLLTRRSK